jgi:hypothetical protein
MKDNPENKIAIRVIALSSKARIQKKKKKRRCFMRIGC